MRRSSKIGFEGGGKGRREGEEGGGGGRGRREGEEGGGGERGGREGEIVNGSRSQLTYNFCHDLWSLFSSQEGERRMASLGQPWRRLHLGS